MSAAEYIRVSARKGKRAHKYSATKTPGPDGAGGTMTHDSKKGAALATRLEQERQAGTIAAFAPEVSVIVGDLGGKHVRHRVDMLVIHEINDDGTFVGEWVEAKGFDAPAGKRKRLALERRLGTKVRVI